MVIGTCNFNDEWLTKIEITAPNSNKQLNGSATTYQLTNAEAPVRKVGG
jgi:hypothetical protein